MKIDQKAYIILGAGALIVWLMIQFMYVPQLKNIKMLQQSLESNKQRNLRVNQLGQDKKFFENLIEKVDRYHNEVRSLMPKEIKLSGLLRELSLLAKKNDVTLLSIRPLEQGNMAETETTETEKLTELFQSADIEIVLKCRYENLGRYVQAVENNNLTVMAIKDIHITADEEADDKADLKVVLVIEAFYKGG
jgi:DNA-binding protein